MGTLDRLRPLAFRGKPRVLSPFAPKEGWVTAPVFGYSLRLDLGNFVDRMIYLGCYEPLNTHRFRRLLRPGMTVVDVGANIGYFTLLAARLVGPEGSVFAIEPHPLNHGHLQETLSREPSPQVKLFRLGFSDAEGSGRIGMIDPKLFPNRTASMVDADETQPAVPLTTLDSFAERHGIERIDLLKIDVDGFEPRVLAGARHCLTEGIVRHVLVELNPFWLEKIGSSASALESDLKRAGFEDVSAEDRFAAFLLGPSADRLYRKQMK